MHAPSSLGEDHMSLRGGRKGREGGVAAGGGPCLERGEEERGVAAVGGMYEWHTFCGLCGMGMMYETVWNDV